MKLHKRLLIAMMAAICILFAMAAGVLVNSLFGLWPIIIALFSLLFVFVGYGSVVLCKTEQ